MFLFELFYLLFKLLEFQTTVETVGAEFLVIFLIMKLVKYRGVGLELISICLD